jgi:hypothetical protein
VSWRLSHELLFVIVAVLALEVSSERLPPSWRRGRSNGRERPGRRDGHDRAIMTVRGLYASVLHGDRGVTKVGSHFAGARA